MEGVMKLSTSAARRVQFSQDALRRWVAAQGTNQAELQEMARLERQRHYGNRLFLRAVVEISNHCDCSCLYCGMRRQNGALDRYRLTHEEIMEAIGKALDLGIRTIMLQSGEDPSFEADAVCRICSETRKMGAQNVILCLGMRPLEQYQAFLAAGANKYILKHETANPVLFAKAKPGITLFARLHHLLNLRRLGFAIGTGCICGLPGQTDEDLADDVLLMRRIRPDMSSVSPFVPSDDSPYGKHPQGDLERTINLMAIMRLALGAALIPSVSALDTLSPGFQLRGLNSGANVMTLNMTPRNKRNNYLIYKEGRRIVDLDHVQRLAEQAHLEPASFPES